MPRSRPTLLPIVTEDQDGDSSGRGLDVGLDVDAGATPTGVGGAASGGLSPHVVSAARRASATRAGWAAADADFARPRVTRSVSTSALSALSAVMGAGASAGAGTEGPGANAGLSGFEKGFMGASELPMDSKT